MKNFKFNARNVAESMWGRGGTKSYATNRSGVYYYSCSSHGGYVVKKEALSEEELAAISPYVKPLKLNLLTNVETGEVYGVDYSHVAKLYRPRRFRYPYGAQVEWREYEFYAFEEDCEWSVLEALTEVTSSGRTKMTPEEIKAYALKTFERWYKNEETA